MRTLRTVVLTLIIVAVGAAAGAYAYLRTHTFAGRAKPSGIEAWVAGHALAITVPASAKAARNPIAVVTPEVIAQARDDFAKDCAFCHGNDGRWRTPAGSGMYPPPPDLRYQDETTDGELFYFVHEGIRWSGMPGWNLPDDRIWKLVSFIRYLPTITPADLQAMDAVNHLGTGVRRQ